MAQIFVISDTHFGHTRVIEYDNRPFKTVYDMWTTMRDNWNSVVTSDDIVYHLGDVAFGSPGYTNELISELNGYKILIRGNHDGSLSRASKLGFNEVYDNLVIDDDIYLIHDPHKNGLGKLVYTPANIKTILHGHLHTKGWLSKIDNKRTFWNMGCMRWNYTPVNLIDIK